MNSHFVDPEYFLISLWPGPTPIEDIRTIKTESKIKFKTTKMNKFR